MLKFLRRNWFVITSIFILVAVAFYVIVLGAGKDMYVFGHKPFIVVSGSMEPELKTHALAIVKKQPFEAVKIDEIAVFLIDKNGQAASHRVIEIQDNGLVTKGDNNADIDFGLVTKDKYLGKIVWYSNGFADYFNVVTSPGGLLKYLILPVVLLIIFVICIGYGIKSLRKKSHKKPVKK